MNWQWLAGNDRAISYGIAKHITGPCPWLWPLDRELTLLADWPVLLRVAVLAAGWLLLHGGRARWAALLVLLPLPLALTLTHIVRDKVHRPRFQDVLVQPKPEGFSFPSEAALTAAAVYGSVGLLVGRRLRGLAQGILQFAAFVLPFAIGVSRLFVLNHYLSDVFASWGAGAALAFLCRGIDGWLEPDASQPQVLPAPAAKGRT